MQVSVLHLFKHDQDHAQQRKQRQHDTRIERRSDRHDRGDRPVAVAVNDIAGVALLEEFEPYWAYGYWDYLEGAEAAVGEYQSWVSEIEASMATEAEELGGSVDGLHRTSAERKYVVATVLFLLDTAYPPAEVDDEELFYKRGTFHELVTNLPRLDPHTIRADATYVVPGNPEDGFSEDDLASEGWQYLQPLWG